jgi:uncharacterized protein (TIGR02186 family)
LKTKRLYTKLMLCLAVILLMSGSVTLADNSSNGLSISPDKINVSAFYNGSEVEISANVYDCDDAVIVLKGKDEEVALNRKGRVAGIWLNVAQITISGLPEAYILAASKELDSICSAGEQEKLGLGKQALKRSMKVSSNKPLTGKEFEEFLKLKMHNGTYDMKEKVEFEPAEQGMQRVTSHFKVPSVMAPGIYNVHLLCFKQGKLESEMTSDLEIDRIGMPKLMISLAYNHAALYGLFAILVAMGVGILMDVIFNSVPGSGH